MIKQNQGKIFQTGIIVGILLFVLNSIEGFFSGGLYATSDPALWQSMTGNWWINMLIFDLIVGLIMTLVFSVLNKGIPDKGLGKGVQFGFWVWLVGNVPGLIMTMLTMTVPAELVVVWLISGLINLVLVGMVLGSMLKFEE